MLGVFSDIRCSEEIEFESWDARTLNARELWPDRKSKQYQKMYQLLVEL